MSSLKIALDIDQTIADFLNPYFSRFGQPKNDYEITKNVFRKLRFDKDFWINLPILDNIQFIPELYCTKRVNPKSYTKEWLKKHKFPARPIYQMYYQHGNKADLIKGKCDVLIDDSISNVKMAINSGLPALLITRPHNKHENFRFRINNLDIEEIRLAYELEKYILKWN